MVKPTVSPSNWRATGFSVQGARHVQNNTPCQDAFHIQHHKEYELLAVAIADGHGDPKHAHSDVGAQVAVKEATKLLLLAAEDLLLDPTISPKSIEDRLYMHLPKRIAYEWNRSIKTDNRLEKNGAWHEILVKYGTTILGAVVSPHFALFIQLGDGDIMIMNTEAQQRFIFSQSEDLFGSVTHSLCQPNSHLHTQVKCERLSDPRLLILSTDGIRDCLEDESAMMKIPNWYLRKVKEEGWDALDDILPNWLSQLSERGNGDDATITIIEWKQENEGGESQ